MATKRRRGDSWQYTIKRAGLLPQPGYLSFASEAEGDEYVRRLEVISAPELFGMRISVSQGGDAAR